jgi:hypothetical protein
MGNVFNIYKSELFKANIDIENDTIKVMLVTTEPDIDNDTVRADITGEVTWSNYTAGGNVVNNLTVDLDTGNDRASFDGDDVTFSNVDGTDIAAFAVLYKDTGNASTDTLIGYFTPATARAAGGGDFVVQWNANGLVRLS